MGPITYAVFTYGLTAFISFAVIGVIVLINALMTPKEKGKEDR